MKGMMGDSRKEMFMPESMEEAMEDCEACEGEGCEMCEDSEMKVVVEGDSPEAISEGLSKAEQIMKMKLGE